MVMFGVVSTASEDDSDSDGYCVKLIVVMVDAMSTVAEEYSDSDGCCVNSCRR